MKNIFGKLIRTVSVFLVLVLTVSGALSLTGCGAQLTRYLEKSAEAREELAAREEEREKVQELFDTVSVVEQEDKNAEENQDAGSEYASDDTSVEDSLEDASDSTSVEDSFGDAFDSASVEDSFEDASDPDNAEETAASPDPTYEYHFRNSKLLNQHFEKHGIEMGFDTPEQYELAASAVIFHPDVLHKTEAEDGDDIYYLESTNEFVVVSTDGYIRTYFLPDKGKAYYDKQ